VARWHGRAQAAGIQLADAAAAVLAGLQPYSEASHHLDDGLRTFAQVGFVEPVQAIGFLAFGWAIDKPRWTQQLTSMPAAAAGVARDPWGTFRSGVSSAAGLEHFQAGRWGAGVGTIAGGFIGGKGFKNVLKGKPVDADIRDKFPGAVFASHLGRPSPQTIDEMLTNGVNLSRHEHGDNDMGHTLRRHVNVNDDYLNDRLDHGTILDNGQRGDIPLSASAWTDLETAETSITHALRANEAVLRMMMLNPGRPGITFSLDAETADGAVVGRSMWDEDGERHVKESTAFKVVLKWTHNGDFVVYTSYPER